jgi:hypothetical protein
MVESFKLKLQAIAGVANTSLSEVVRVWDEYKALCDGRDQSASLTEFIDMYKNRLQCDYWDLFDVI